MTARYASGETPLRTYETRLAAIGRNLRDARAARDGASEDFWSLAALCEEQIRQLAELALVAERMGEELRAAKEALARAPSPTFEIEVPLGYAAPTRFAIAWCAACRSHVCARLTSSVPLSEWRFDGHGQWWCRYVDGGASPVVRCDCSRRSETSAPASGAADKSENRAAARASQGSRKAAQTTGRPRGTKAKRGGNAPRKGRA